MRAQDQNLVGLALFVDGRLLKARVVRMRLRDPSRPYARVHTPYFVTSDVMGPQAYA